MSQRFPIPATHAACVACLLLSLLGSAAATDKLPVLRLNVGKHSVVAEVASTRAQQETGLMYRRSLAQDHGMLFVFRQDQDVCMWMKNTYVPLSVAFIARDGEIRRISDMRPLTLDAHCAGYAVRYALEMPRGWFAAHAVTAGTEVRDLPAPASAGD